METHVNKKRQIIIFLYSAESFDELFKSQSLTAPEFFKYFYTFPSYPVLNDRLIYKSGVVGHRSSDIARLYACAGNLDMKKAPG